MHVWQVQEAKAKLTQLMKDAQREPQVISRHGINEMVVIKMEQYLKLIGEKKDIVAFLRNSPLYGVDLEATRDDSSIRDIEL